MKVIQKKVMVFGVFDGFHKGHQAFLQSAKKEGNHLIVVVPEDLIVFKLKKRQPQNNTKERIKAIKESGLASQVIRGDKQLGSWEVIKKHKPHIIALGYDQYYLEKELERNLPQISSKTAIKKMPPFKPEKYHSSKIYA